MFSQLTMTHLNVFHIHTLEKVLTPVFWPDFEHFTEFFGPPPGLSQECLGTIGERPRTILGTFRDNFPDFFGKCSGSVPGPFPSMIHAFPGVLGIDCCVCVCVCVCLLFFFYCNAPPARHRRPPFVSQARLGQRLFG